jgi:hypothetical protein
MRNYRNCFGNALTVLLCSVIFFASCKKDDNRSADCEIVSFSVNTLTWDISGTEITRAYPPGTTESLFTPTINLSPGATVNPPASEAQNFFTEQGVTYTVTAENGVTKKNYVARATITPYSLCDIVSFSVGGVEWNIDGDVITYVYPPETVETPLTPVIALSPEATINPPANREQNFFTAQGVRYTVTAEDGVTTKTYTARAIRTPYSLCDIVSFSVNGVEWDIDGDVITYVYPSETVETPLTPTIALPTGATINPPTDREQNFFTEQGVTYTVTAEDGVTTKTYTARARRESRNCDIVSFNVDGAEWNISGSVITYVYQSETASLTPVITLPPGATVYPPSGEAQNFFTTAGVRYTVTAEDGTTKIYTAKATVRTGTKYDMSDWTVVPRYGIVEWDGTAGFQNRWTGGHPMLILDDDPDSGWHSAYDNNPPFPQALIIDMKQPRQVSEVVGHGLYLNTVQIYLTDDHMISGYRSHTVNWNEERSVRETNYFEWADDMKNRIPADLPASSWGSPVQASVTNDPEMAGWKNFSRAMPQTSQGRFLIILFPDNTLGENADTWIAVYSVEVYGH